eukprot:TRINITY_DN985_c0_g1_i1.p2 TRINITY_DN985_c0_g1~~TRINITY_DN985_c0_g1_i1.p2  ORF type:complete len:240 (-),score=66.65 TRINITY_DN985_c0_g1_i1:136-855(-)
MKTIAFVLILCLVGAAFAGGKGKGKGDKGKGHGGKGHGGKGHGGKGHGGKDHGKGKGDKNANPKQICEAFVKQCKEAAKSLSGTDQAKLEKFCKRLETTIAQCPNELKPKASCFNKCKNECAKQTGANWFGCFLSCERCNGENSGSNPENTCNTVVNQCKTLAKGFEDQPKIAESINGVCNDLASKKDTCVAEVKKNPLCYSFCSQECQDNVEKHDIKAWGQCVSACGICEKSSANLSE